MPDARLGKPVVGCTEVLQAEAYFLQTGCFSFRSSNTSKTLSHEGNIFRRAAKSHRVNLLLHANHLMPSRRVLSSQERAGGFAVRWEGVRLSSCIPSERKGGAEPCVYKGKVWLGTGRRFWVQDFLQTCPRVPRGYAWEGGLGRWPESFLRIS